MTSAAVTATKKDGTAAEPLCDCIQQSWSAHERELLQFLQQRLENRYDAEDLLQELFIRLLRQGNAFCSVRQPRAWLFQVARNALIDRQRVKKPFVELPPELPEPEVQQAAIELMESCVWRNLQELSDEDREIIRACDLLGMRQKVYAEQHGLSLVAAKARLQRARRRLRELIVSNCQVRFDENGRVCCYKPR